MTLNSKIVSFNDDELILVDHNDTIIGYETKALCHEGTGLRHRAFSIFIFNDASQLLLQKRSRFKELWPLYWSNSCCSHPRKNEDMDTAIQRRLKEELGIAADIYKYLFKFEYHAQYTPDKSERENCHVYIGRSSDTIHINSNEIEDWKYIDLGQVDGEIRKNTDLFTPWCLIEWEHITKNHVADIYALISS